MAKKRKIFIHRNSENIHNTASKIFIHTGCLRAVHSFGQSVFHKNLNFINNESASLLFTGKYASQLTP